MGKTLVTTGTRTYCGRDHKPVIGSKRAEQANADKTSENGGGQGEYQRRDVDAGQRHGSGDRHVGCVSSVR